MDINFFEKILVHLKTLTPRQQASTVDHTLIFCTGVWLALHTLLYTDYVGELTNQVGIIFSPYFAVLGIIAFILLSLYGCSLVVFKFSNYT